MLPINSVPATVTGRCYGCGEVTTQCAECAVSIEIDPVTGLPPDVAIGPDGAVLAVPHGQIDAQVLARAVAAPVCDRCVGDLIAGGKEMTSATDRHNQGRCANAGLI